MTTTDKSAAKVQPYLFFDGRCEEALEFYKKALGAKVGMLMRFKDSPEQPKSGDGCGGAGGSPDKVMHAEFTVGNTSILASDGECGGKPEFRGFSLSLTVVNEAEAERVFAAIGEGGQVQMPLMKTFFSASFGMVADQFGVNWMVYVAAPA